MWDVHVVGNPDMIVVFFSVMEQLLKVSRVMRKPDFCLCKNKGADQLLKFSAFVFATR